MTRISAVITARNEEANLPFCLETVKWCDEIVVVDMESEDGTAAVARRYTDRVFGHEKVPAFDVAKGFAVEQATGEWILLVDADEMVPRPLASLLRDIADKGTADIVEVPFRHYIMGDWVRRSGWGQGPLPRFFRKGTIRFQGRIHGYMRKEPSARILRISPSEGTCFHHFAYLDSSQFVEKMNRYTTVEAMHLRDDGVRFSFLRMSAACLREFLFRFVKGRAFLDGRKGIFLTLLMVFYRALSYIKLRELEEFGDAPPAIRYEARKREILSDWTVRHP